MTLDELIEEYRSLPQFCDNIDYGDKQAVKKNNKSVDRMDKIVETIRDKFKEDGLNKLKTLLDIEEHKTNLWIATHLLEKVNVDKETEEKSLEIIKRISSTNELMELGFRSWLEEYERKRGK